MNQVFLLTRAVRNARGLPSARRLPFTVSGISSILKSLSPAGKKLTPMLAISSQGLLFSVGTILFGANWLGSLIGAALLSLWPFIQPLLIYYFLFGATLIEVGALLAKKLEELTPVSPDVFGWALLAWILAQITVSMLLALFAYFISDARYGRYENRLTRAGQRIRNRIQMERGDSSSPHFSAASALALRDLLHPLFLIFLAITMVFFIYAEAPLSVVIWGFLRPIAAGFLLFFMIRALPLESILNRLENSRFRQFGSSFRIALQTLKRL
jgi:hypothetical protein